VLNKPASAVLSVAALAALASVAAGAGQQVVDPDFKPSVARPAYPSAGPTVAIDEAHKNFHTAAGQYKPFAELLRADGYTVIASTRRFEPGAFAGIDVLVIANANAGNLTDPAFAESECDVVGDWVRGGGSLLLIADHAPFGTSAANLGRRFGVAMGKGWAFDRTEKGDSITTQLTFSRANGLLGDHAILRGRDASEQIGSVRTFTGQSLGLPDGATALLKLSATAREAPLTSDLDAEAAAAADAARGGSATVGSRSASVAGRVQGLALTMGQGRVVILGEAAMFSAQVVTLDAGGTPRTFRAGMNVPGNDDQQFALNVVRWLSGALRQP
jgi:hypothetical protein